MVNTAAPKGTSTAENATTTANYSNPSFSLTISPKVLTATAKDYSVTGTSLNIDSLKKLISIDSISGDDVAITIVSVTISGTTYDLTDDAQKTAAAKALAGLTVKSGENAISISYSSALKGADAGNYSVAAGSIANAVLTVTTPFYGGGTSTTDNGTDTDVLINGEAHSAGKTETATGSDGRTKTTVTVDTDTLSTLLKGKGNGATVTIPMDSDSETETGALTGDMVKIMENRDATLEIRTKSASYFIPASEIDIDAVLQSLGTNVTLSDIAVSVSISEPTSATAAIVADAASSGGFTIAVPAVNFTITCTYNGKTVDVSTFSSYVRRTIAIPDGVDPSKITTGIVVNPDGSVHHVPTRVIVIDGKYYAVISSLTNSTYTVIWHPVEFSDVTSHWAKDAINDMGSRMVVTRVGDNNYEPDRDITRAEFAAIVVRALGLDTGMGTSSFTDVGSSAWYYGYIQTAAGYGIITGYGDGTFGPNDTITREQAMTMIARAMSLTGLAPKLDADQIASLLSGFTDASGISNYAEASVAACIKTGVILGRTSTTVASKDFITRAEVAVIIERMLQKSNLI